MKAAAILRELAARGGFDTTLVHTGQHYDEKMSQVFFKELEIPRPDVDLGVGSGSHAAQTAAIMRLFEPVVLERQPDAVLVVGDVNSTVACALVAAKLGVAVGHVEAGLRSGDRTMPEEINRMVTDAISDLLFTTEPSANENLRREGHPPERIHYVGNTMIDTLLHNRAKAEASDVLERLGLCDGPGLPARPYAVLTLHRPSNVDSPEVLTALMDAIAVIASDVPVIFPVHPRTTSRMAASGLDARMTPLDEANTAGSSGIYTLPPVGYLDFLKLMASARLVLTDSGGIQEETAILGVPCVTLRENTERPITIDVGANTLVGRDADAIIRKGREALAKEERAAPEIPLWDGKAGARIADAMAAACPTGGAVQ